MPISVTIAIEILAALSALAAGAIFLASTLVLRALRSVPTADGIRAMNANNLATAKPIAVLLSGAALLYMTVVLIWLFDWPWDRLEEPGALMAIVGGVVYSLGAILVTIERSMPLNKLLGTATNASGDMIWRVYRRDWGMWNHVRIATCTAASALLVAAVVVHTVHAIDSARKINSIESDCMDIVTGNMVPCD